MLLNGQLESQKLHWKCSWQSCVPVQPEGFAAALLPSYNARMYSAVPQYATRPTALRSASSFLFDHNADGLKTGTQWTKGDDGILVRDLNGNGTIDSGRELFGDQTQISSVNAAGQTITTLATHGFAALKALDKDAAGLADGTFNASDVAYAELKVWRDLNQDGISQSNELLGLAEYDVFAINLVKNVNLMQVVDCRRFSDQRWSKGQCNAFRAHALCNRRGQSGLFHHINAKRQAAGLKRFSQVRARTPIQRVAAGNQQVKV